MTDTVSSAVAVIDRPTVEQLADADARRLSPTLTGIAAITPATPPAANRTHLPRIIFDTRTLDDDAYVIHRNLKNGHHRIIWDPAQTTRAKVETYINIHIAGTGQYIEVSRDVDRALRDLDTMRATDPDPKAVAFCDYLEELIIDSGDPAGVFEEVLDILQGCRALTGFLAEHGIKRVLANGPSGDLLTEPLYWRERDGRRFLLTPPGTDPDEALEYVRDAFAAEACIAYTWCSQRGEHDDHTSETVAVNPDKPDDLDAVIMRLYEVPKPSIVVGNADLDAAQARVFAAWLVAAADMLDATEQVHA